MTENPSPKRRPQKPPKVVIRPYRIRAAEIRKFVREMVMPKMPANLLMIDADFQLSSYILLEFLGPDWIIYYLADKGLMRQSTYFGDIDKFFLRVSTLAEMLLNLQDVPGFRGCLELLAAGQIEAAFAELEVAKFLSLFGVRFSFNERQSRAKEDYDLNVVFRNGEQGYAETKCKYEDTKLSENTILNSLRGARRQLPDARPGVIFIKVPEIWIEQQRFREDVNAAVKRFLRDTQTVVAVELFATGFKCIGPVAEPIVGGAEIMNQHHKFDATRDWSLIGPIFPHPMQMSPPSWWKSIPALIDPSIDPRLFRS